MYNAFGLVQGSDVRDRGRQRRHGHRPRHQRGQARGGHGRAHRRARHAGQGHALLVRAAVADRRVLHLLRARRAADSGGRRRRRPDGRTSRRVTSSRRSRPTSSRTPCASRSASAWRCSSTSSGPRSPAIPDSLNEAIRLGAPALTQLRKVTQILASQNTIIRDLNANSDQVIGRLAERREDVVRFIKKARDTAEASAARREDLSQRLRASSTTSSPSCARPSPSSTTSPSSRRRCSPTCAPRPRASTASRSTCPPFNGATEASLRSLGERVAGRRAGAAPRGRRDQAARRRRAEGAA